MSGPGKGAFSGTLSERVVLLVRDAIRDDLGGASGGWADGVRVWAAVRPDGAGADDAGVRLRWAVTMRTGVAVPERLRWGAVVLVVRRCTQDPARPDRIVLHTEETR